MNLASHMCLLCRACAAAHPERMADKVALFTVGFACGMVTVFGLGVHAAQRVTAEAASGMERVAANALLQAQATRHISGARKPEMLAFG